MNDYQIVWTIEPSTRPRSGETIQMDRGQERDRDTFLAGARRRGRASSIKNAPAVLLTEPRGGQVSILMAGGRVFYRGTVSGLNRA